MDRLRASQVQCASCRLLQRACCSVPHKCSVAALPQHHAMRKTLIEKGVTHLEGPEDSRDQGRFRLPLKQGLRLCRVVSKHLNQ